MLEVDTNTLEPIATFVRRRNDKLPSGRKLVDAVHPDVMKAAEEFVVEFRPLAEKAERQAKTDREIETAQAVFEETRYLAGEVSLLIQAATMRYPAVREVLKPRQGTTPDEHVVNLPDMRARLDANRELLKDNEIEVKLDPRHSAAAITAHVAKHKQAVDAIATTERLEDGDQSRLVALRKEGAHLQSRINAQLRAAAENDRGTQLQFGLTERENYRKPAGARKSAAPVVDVVTPGPIAAGGATPTKAEPAAGGATPAPTDAPPPSKPVTPAGG